MPTSTEKLPLDEVVNPYTTNAPADDPSEVEQTPEIIEETPPEVPETPEKAPESTEKPPSRSKLSEQLTATTAELEKIKGEVGTYDQKYKDALAKQEELEKAVKERDDSFLRERTPVYRWEEDPEVANPRKKAAMHLTRSLVKMTPEVADVVKADILPIVDAYGDALAKGEGALRAFKKGLIEKFGEDGERVFDTAETIYPEHAAALEALQRNSIGHFDRTRTEYEKGRRTVTDRFTQIGRATKEQIEASPDDPNSVISAALAGDEEALKEIELLARRAADATVGLPPLPPDATPEIIVKYRQSERNRNSFMRTAFEKDVQIRALVPLVKKLTEENAALKKRVTAASEGNRPEIKTETTTGKKVAKTEVPKDGDFAEIQNPYL